MKEETYKRLPEAAKKHIYELEREIVRLKSELEKALGQQKPTEWYTETRLKSGTVRRYFEADVICSVTSKLDVSMCYTEDGNLRVYMGSAGRGLAAVFPQATNCIEIRPVP